ncbi:hypothetical protein BDR22DRAFT_834549 [Usnea florida]
MFNSPTFKATEVILRQQPSSSDSARARRTRPSSHHLLSLLKSPIFLLMLLSLFPYSFNTFPRPPSLGSHPFTHYPSPRSSPPSLADLSSLPFHQLETSAPPPSHPTSYPNPPKPSLPAKNQSQPPPQPHTTKNKHTSQKGSINPSPSPRHPHIPFHTYPSPNRPPPPPPNPPIHPTTPQSPQPSQAQTVYSKQIHFPLRPTVLTVLTATIHQR